MPIEQPIFKKSHTALVMIPQVGRLTAMSRKLLNSMYQHAQQHLLALPDKGAYFSSVDFFEQDLIELIRPIGSPSSNAVSMMKDHMLQMQSVIVTWTSPDQTQGVIWDSLVLVSQVKMRVENNRVRVMWSFPPDIVKSLVSPDYYTILRLEDLALIKSYAAVALYEIALRYSTSPTNLTSRKPKEWWVAALTPDSNRTSLKDKTPQKLRDWRMFKHEKVLPAIEEINSRTGLQIELVEHKKGRVVVDVQFHVRRQTSEKQTKTVQTGPCFVAAARLGIPEKDIISCLDRNHDPYSEEEVLLALAKVEARRNKPGAVPVSNPAAYFKKVIVETKGVSLFSALGHKPVENALVVDEKTPAGTLQAPAASNVDQPPTHRMLMAKQFRALSIEEQRVFAMAARERLAEKNLLSPLASRHIETGKWYTGVIMSTILDIYEQKSATPSSGSASEFVPFSA